MTPHGFGAEDPAPLRSQFGQRDLLPRAALRYTIGFVPGVDQGERYRVEPLAYSYGILDGEDREIVLFHWHPSGMSDVLTRHLHVPCVGKVALGTLSGKGNRERSVDVGRMHVPTGYISMEDVVELLVNEFDVEPRRPDWLDVLTANRAGVEGIAAR